MLGIILGWYWNKWSTCSLLKGQKAFQVAGQRQLQHLCCVAVAITPIRHSLWLVLTKGVRVSSAYPERTSPAVVCVCVYVWLCVWERENERERDRVRDRERVRISKTQASPAIWPHENVPSLLWVWGRGRYVSPNVKAIGKREVQVYRKLSDKSRKTGRCNPS